jgi:integrase
MASNITARTLLRRTPGTVNDPNVPGLRLVVGKRTRTFRMSPRINGIQRNLKVYTVTAADLEEAGKQLKAARDAARQIMADAANGVDPTERARTERREAQKARQNSFRAVAERYMAEDGNMTADAGERWRKLNKEIFPVFGDTPIRDLSRADVKDYLLEKAAATPTQADHHLRLIRRILNFALDDDLVGANVAARIKLPGKLVARDRYLNKPEIKTFWNGLNEAAMTPQVRLILKMLLVTGARRGEVTGLHWDEISVEDSWWEIPGSRTKNGNPHRVHLTPLAWEIIRQAGTTEDYVFAKVNGQPPVVNAISQAMLRELPALGLADKPARPHDLRRTMATHLGDMGIQPYVVSRLLNHSLAGVTERHYLLSAYAEQKKQALEAWSDKLIEIATGKAPPSNVKQLMAVR